MLFTGFCNILKRVVVATAAGMTFLAVSAVGSSPAYAASCTIYQIDCTSPFAAQTWMGDTKACVNSAFQATPSVTWWAGPNFVTVYLAYTQPQSGAACQTAYGVVSSFNCVQATNCDNLSGGNPRVDVMRDAPSSVWTNTFGISDLGSASKQLRDCCGGFLSRGSGRLLSFNGGTIVSAVTSQF